MYVATTEIERKRQSTEQFMASYLNCFLSVLLVVPVSMYLSVLLVVPVSMYLSVLLVVPVSMYPTRNTYCQT